MNSAGWTARNAITCIKPYFSPRKFINTSVTRLIFGSETSIRGFSLSCNKNMKFAQFTYSNKPDEVRVGYVEGDNVVDINKADCSLPTTLLQLLKNGDLEKVKRLKSSKPPLVPLSSVKLTAPILGMDKVLCIGLNYQDHCEEQKLTPPAVPMIFNKFPSTVIGPGDAVRLRTDVTKKVDWEVELVVVIGKKASDVKAANAYDYILGYTVAQDISARDWQKERNGGQFLLGKAMDTFCPIGPYIVSADEITDPQALDIKCSVNSVLKQTSNTCNLVHKIPDVIERLSSNSIVETIARFKSGINAIYLIDNDCPYKLHHLLHRVMTLLPGDILLTGTPGGVGMYRSPPEYLKPGDVIHSEIQCIGVLETKVSKF